MTGTAVVQRYLDAVNAYDWAAVADLTVERLAGGVRHGLWQPNPDLRLEPEWFSEQADKVTVWMYGTGTHTEPWTLPPTAGSVAGTVLAPTGRRWRAACSATYQVTDERLVDVWAVWDFLGLLGQLGVAVENPNHR